MADFLARLQHASDFLSSAESASSDSQNLCDSFIDEMLNEIAEDKHLLHRKHRGVIFRFVHYAATKRPYVVLKNIDYLFCHPLDSEKTFYIEPERFILLSELLIGIRLPIPPENLDLTTNAVKTWCSFASAGLASPRSAVRAIFSTVISSLWRKNQAVLEWVIDHITKSTVTLYSLLLTGRTVSFLRDNAMTYLLENHKRSFVENLLKYAFSGKSTLSLHNLLVCSEVITACVDLEYFKASVMPVLQRAILRSAEANLTAVDAIIDKVSFSLDPCAADLAKPIVKYLSAISGAVREESVHVLTTIISRCSEADTVSELYKAVHTQLTSPEGKKAGHEARLSGLSCLGAMSAHNVKQLSHCERLANTSVNLMLDYMEQETHEATLIYATEELSKWLRGFQSNLPERFYSFVKTATLNSKIPTTVRCAYLACLDTGLAKINIGKRLPAPLVSSLLTAVQRGLGQPNHSPLLCESICGSLVWLRHFVSTRQQLTEDCVKTELQVTPVWNLLAASSCGGSGTGLVARKAWFSDRFMRLAPEYVLRKLASLMELALSKLYDFLPFETQSAVCRMLLLLALHPHYAAVRWPALKCLATLLQPAGKASLTEQHRWLLAQHLLSELFHCLQEANEATAGSMHRLPFEERYYRNAATTCNTVGGIRNQPGVEVKTAFETTHHPGIHVWDEIPPHTHTTEKSGDGSVRSPNIGAYASQLITLIVKPFAESAPRERVQSVYVSCLFPASHPIVFSSSPLLWERLQLKLNLPACVDSAELATTEDLICQDEWPTLVHYFMDLSSVDETHCCAVQRLVRWAPMQFGKLLFDVLHDRLSSDRLLSVTKQDIEIMLTPENELYNQELLDNLPKYQTSRTNVKRESKLYSYDVQMDILTARRQSEELQRTTAEQRVLPSLLDQLSKQLTEKQLESVRGELNKEASIRIKTIQLDAEARFLTSLLRHALGACLPPSNKDTFATDRLHTGKRGRLTLHVASRFSRLALSINNPYSLLFERLFDSPLTAPYTLRAYANCVLLMVTAAIPPCVELPGLLRQGNLFAWWSIRLLQPTRIFRHRSEADNGADLDHRQYRNGDAVEAAVRDTEELTSCWSTQSISEQTTTVLEQCLTTYSTRNPNAMLVFSFLFPTLERILISSGWALPLEEEQHLGRTWERELITGEQNQVWSWVDAVHCQKLLTIWLNQLQPVNAGSDRTDEELRHHQVTLYTLPFDRLLRLMRQVVDSCLADASNRWTSASPSDLSAASDTAVLTSTENINQSSVDEVRLDLARPLAQLALEVIRSATALFCDQIAVEASESLDDIHINELASEILSTLVVGLVSPSYEAREICGKALLMLIEKVPSFIDRVTLFSNEYIKSDGKDARAPKRSDVDEEPEGEQEIRQEPTSNPKLDTSKAPRKKLNKAQRLKHRQAALLSKATEAAGTNQMTKPFTNPSQWPKLTLWKTLQVRIWVARSDFSPEVAILAQRLWTSLKLPDIDSAAHPPKLAETLLLTPMVLAQRLLLETTRPIPVVQQATADAFALCLFHRNSSDEVAVALEQLIQLYRTMLHREPAVKDTIDRIVVPESPDLWRERLGLAMALARLPETLNRSDTVARTLRRGYTAATEAKDVDDEDAIVLDTEASSLDAPSEALVTIQSEGKPKRADAWLLSMFRFLVPEGLNDRNPMVAAKMLQAGLRAVAIYGKANIDQLLPILEGFLSKAPNVAELDSVRQSTLLLTGSLSQHLAADDPKVVNVFNRLVNTLSFPSDLVQQSVEDCLASLVSKLPEEHVSKTVSRLMVSLLGSAGYAERNGAAHGITGIARGLGIMSLKHHGIIDKILPALNDTKSGKRREGALMAIERLCLGLGRLFEPYVIRLISGLLNAFGDASPNVREAASNTARAVMSKLSAHGVKLLLPALLRAIDDQQSWRTKAESVELLATMTHCAPKQLSACLPQIVPRLLEVLVDSQDRVKQAGVRALRQIGGVIRNPEVQALVPLLTRCLQDPLADKMPCLLALQDTCFIHVLGAPSLALILPVIQRALNERSTEARKIAAQIFGNLPSLSRKEELQPYVGNILPPLKMCLLDAVPEVRSVASAALGALVRGMGESCFSEILPWLISTLTSESSSADRSGAAQGLAEVLGAMGIDRLRLILSDLIQTTAESESRVQAHVRDGYLMLFVYLPVVFQDSFKEFIGPIIPNILKSLSDEAEFLRETALRAAQRIIQMFADSSIELLLPELEKGMSDQNWRIRHASVQLLGDLLFQLSGLSGKGTTKTLNEDDTFGSSEVHVKLKQAMGHERHDRILARLHIARSDPTLIVRQAAIHVWKVVVANTSRTLREIVPVLIRILLSMLGASNREQQQLAARALGDIVKKLGERILPEIIPLLVAGLDSPDSDQRRGVCSGLNEIMRNCPREQLVNYSDSLLVPLRRTLCDRLPEVRRSGAKTFDLLYGSLGLRTLDGILPDLLAQLDDAEVSEEIQACALDGVRQLLVVRGKAVMPYLVPKLTYPTVNVKAFAYLATVAGDALTRQLNRILPALLTTVEQLGDGSEGQEDLNHCASVLICIYDVGGVRYILNELLTGLITTSSSGSATNSPAHRIACLRLLHAYLELSNSSDVEADGDDTGDTRHGDLAPNQHKIGTLDKSSAGASDEDEESSEEFGDDDYEESDESNSDGDDGDSDNTLDDLNDEDVPDARDTISRVLKEVYPLMLRNICRLLALDDKTILIHTWNCLESLFARWSPETVGTQINDIRQGIRGAVSELNKMPLGHRVAASQHMEGTSAPTLPGFSDPSLPLVSLVKMYADCTLRGRPESREPSAQALAECINSASGTALQRCTVKVIGPLIRLLGERQTNVVRVAVVDSLTALVSKCPQSARPFVTQLQATFLKCLGDAHRPVRLLAGRGLACLVVITPKLDPLLADLARVPVQAILGRCPTSCLPAVTNAAGVPATATSTGAAATALTLAGLAAYPDTCLQALRLCLLASTGRASLSALQSISSLLAPVLCLPDGVLQEDIDLDDEVILVEDNDDHDGTGSSAFNTTTVRVTAATCLGSCVVAAAGIKSTDGTAAEAVAMLLNHLFPKSNEKSYSSWEFQQSQTVVLLIVLKHAPSCLLNAVTIQSGTTSRLEKLLDKLFVTPTAKQQHPIVVCQTALRCVGCLLGYIVETPGLDYNANTSLQLLYKAMKHELTDIRLLATVVANHIAWRANVIVEPTSQQPSWIPDFLALLVQGGRENASSVRLGSETALAVLCRLGAPVWKGAHSSGAICRACIDAAQRGVVAAGQSMESVLQRLRKQNWSDVWRQGPPDMDNTMVL